jgi:hypothetical protein
MAARRHLSVVEGFWVVMTLPDRWMLITRVVIIIRVVMMIITSDPAGIPRGGSITLS